jgi:glycine cleavage system H protein
MSRENELKYTSEHEWVDASEGVATVGVTAYAADQLGDVVYVDLPAVGTEVEAGGSIGEIESTKSVGELYSPVTGTVVEINEAVASAPETVNSDPLGEGWLVKVSFETLPELLDLEQYQALTAEA